MRIAWKYILLMVILPVLAGVGLHQFFEQTNYVRQANDALAQIYAQYAVAGQKPTEYPVLGDPDAPVTIEIYSDFECPFCQQYARVVWPRLVQDYVQTGKARVIYHYMPLPFHEHARPAAYAAMCAHLKGKFWPMHDLLYQYTGQPGFDEAKLLELAEQVGIPRDEMQACLKEYEAQMAAFIDSSLKAAVEQGIRGTPTTVINGQIIPGLAPYSAYTHVIDSILNAQ